MTDLLAYRAQRARAMAKHPAGSQRVNPDTEPRYVCVICTGDIGKCDCLQKLQNRYADRYWPLTLQDVRRVAREEVDRYLDEMADDAMNILMGRP